MLDILSDSFTNSERKNPGVAKRAGLLGAPPTNAGSDPSRPRPWLSPGGWSPRPGGPTPRGEESPRAAPDFAAPSDSVRQSPKNPENGFPTWSWFSGIRGHDRSKWTRVSARPSARRSRRQAALGHHNRKTNTVESPNEPRSPCMGRGRKPRAAREIHQTKPRLNRSSKLWRLRALCEACSIATGRKSSERTRRQPGADIRHVRFMAVKAIASRSPI
jgi:hypothetical protein